MGCNCGKKKRNRAAEKKIETRMAETNESVTDEILEQIVEKMKEGMFIPQAIQELALNVHPGIVRRKILHKYGDGFIQAILLPVAVSQFVENSCKSGDVELVGQAIKICEDMLGRLRKGRKN